MSLDGNISNASHVPQEGTFSTHTQAQIDALLQRMHDTSDPDELVELAQRLQLLAQQPANETSTFDKSELPDWAVHDHDQEGLDAFFNKPADRGHAETAFAIPRGNPDVQESGARSVSYAVENYAEAVGEKTQVDATVREALGQTDQPVSAPKHAAPAPEAEPEPERKPAHAAAPEPKPETESVSAPEAEPASAPAVESESEPALDPAPVVEPEPEPAPEHVAPRREDFARFRCIYESQDGQLALYEDEDGHLTAVNTNRFV